MEKAWLRGVGGGVRGEDSGGGAFQVGRMTKAKPGSMSGYDMEEEEEGREEARARGSQIVADLVDWRRRCALTVR